ncbi:MAG: aldo/keto reductase [Defluviitaleaceae bacterium]|nr:aldo/keto reductase [Defluviitaleaceae bacterium]
MEYVNLNNGIKMPMLGFGVFKVEDGQVCVDAVTTALAEGYRSIDTAAIYGNEKAVGQAIKESGVKRKDIFLTTKLWNEVQRTGNPEETFNKSLQDLGVDYVDLYLIHWPVKGRYVDTWLAMEKIYASGRTKAIGVSNFMPNHIEDIAKVWSVVPALNQYEMHPLLTRKPVLETCKKYGITPQSWGPLGGSKPENKDNLLENPTLQKIANKYNKSTAQIILRWNIDLGIVCIPKSVTPSRIKANIDVFDFKLTSDEIVAIDALNQDARFGGDPNNFDF